MKEVLSKLASINNVEITEHRKLHQFDCVSAVRWTVNPELVFDIDLVDFFAEFNLTDKPHSRRVTPISWQVMDESGGGHMVQHVVGDALSSTYNSQSEASERIILTFLQPFIDTLDRKPNNAHELRTHIEKAYGMVNTNKVMRLLEVISPNV